MNYSIFNIFFVWLRERINGDKNRYLCLFIDLRQTMKQRSSINLFPHQALKASLCNTKKMLVLIILDIFSEKVRIWQNPVREINLCCISYYFKLEQDYPWNVNDLSCFKYYFTWTYMSQHRVNIHSYKIFLVKRSRKRKCFNFLYIRESTQFLLRIEKFAHIRVIAYV